MAYPQRSHAFNRRHYMTQLHTVLSSPSLEGACGNTIRVVGDMMIRSHTDAVSEKESLKASTQQRGPTKSEASLVRQRQAYALVSTQSFASASQDCPVAQDIEASCSPCIPHPSARANGAERTKANSDAVIVFIVFSSSCETQFILNCHPSKAHNVTAGNKRG